MCPFLQTLMMSLPLKNLGKRGGRGGGGEEEGDGGGGEEGIGGCK